MSSLCTRPFDSAPLTFQTTGIWVPEEAVVLLQVFDAGDVLQAQREFEEQQLTLQLGGGFERGQYSVVVSIVDAAATLTQREEGEGAGQGRVLASVTIHWLLK